MPGESQVTLVTIGAVAVLFENRRDAVGIECGYRWSLIAAAYATRVFAASAVTGLALQLSMTEWCA